MTPETKSWLDFAQQDFLLRKLFGMPHGSWIGRNRFYYNKTRLP